MSLSRQIRRAQFKKQLKELENQHKAIPQITEPTLPIQSNEKVQQYINQIGILVKEVENITRSIKVLDNHLYMTIEALSEKGLLSWEDVHTVEKRFLKREDIRREKIQELLKTNKSITQILEEIQDPPNAKKYEMLNINPIKDLNLNPFEVAEAIMLKHPNLTDDDYLKMGKRWDIVSQHFGIEKPVEPIS